MTWSQQRQLSYALGVLLVLGAVGYVAINHATRVEPTCYDGKQNGNEVGADCGGACAFYCRNELAAPKVRWVRFFTVTPGLIHAVAYVEHANPDAAAERATYEFSIYDEKNNILTKRAGTTYIGPLGRSAIVETLIPVGNTVPSIARFSFTGDIVWSKIPPVFVQAVIKTDRFLLESFDGGTRLIATLENQSRLSFQNIDVVAILYDKSDNAIAVSKSLLQSFPGQSSSVMYFTWPTQLKQQTARVEIIPRINPFASTEL